MATTLQRYLDGEFGPGWRITHRDIFGSTVAQGPLGPNDDQQVGVFRDENDSARFYRLDELATARHEYGIADNMFPVMHVAGVRAWGYFRLAW